MVQETPALEVHFVPSHLDTPGYSADVKRHVAQAGGTLAALVRRQEMYWLAYFAVPLAFVLGILNAVRNPSELVIVGVFFALGWQRTLRSVWTHLQRKSLLFGGQLAAQQGEEVSLSISPEGLTNHTPDSRWSLYWPQVTQVISAEHNLLFIAMVNGRRTLYYIPRRAFVSPEAADDYYAAALRFWHAARPAAG